MKKCYNWELGYEKQEVTLAPPPTHSCLPVLTMSMIETLSSTLYIIYVEITVVYNIHELYFNVVLLVREHWLSDMIKHYFFTISKWRDSRIDTTPLSFPLPNQPGNLVQ